MKIFTFTRESGKTHNCHVGMVLISDHNKIYHYSCSTTESDKFESTLLAIKRGLIFVDNMKPLYCNDSVEIYSNLDSYESTLNLDHRINSDEYISKFKKKRNQSVNISLKKHKLEDEQFMRLANTLVSTTERNEYALMLSNKGKEI